MDTFFKPILEHSEQYKRLLADTQYKNVNFSWSTGGLRATHTGHNFNKKGGVYEHNVQEAGFNTGHAVILEDERGYGFRHTEGLWDGKAFEVAGRETATENNILRGLKHCASKGNTLIAILDYPKGGFNQNTLEKAISRYRGLESLNDGQYLRFEKLICVQDNKIVYEKPF